MRIGVDYYPEHWDKKLWKKDVQMMADSGVSIVRMAEFAWSKLEPRENEFDFSWLDEIISMFEEQKIDVFLCTPTNCPPQWMFEKYPEIIQVGKDGRRIATGIRGHRCLESRKFRECSEKIIRKLVSHFKDRSSVIGYQIDNELEANHCCCQECTEKFRQYIKNKYSDIANVNRAYGNNVWSGEYTDFSQIKPPASEFETWLNPSFMLDYNRFASKSTVDYVNYQRDIIKSIDKNALITTNCWLCENMPDFYDMFEKLDFASYDNYPATKLPDDKETLYSHAFHLDLMRGIKQDNFWIMEELSGGLGSWMPMTGTLKPGMLKGYSMQALAHGADTVIHFRWRTAISGAEMFWHGLIDHSNVPGRRYTEFLDLCNEAKKLKELEGAVSKNSVAILYNSDDEYAFKIQPQVEGMHYFTQLKSFHDGFTSIGVGVDVVPWKADLQKYKIVVAPTFFVTDEKIVEKLTNYVEKGGHLVLTNRSGVKDENNKCIMSPLPTVFSDLSGARVAEYDPVGNSFSKLNVSDKIWNNKMDSFSELGDVISGGIWCDILQKDTAQALATYSTDFYRGETAIAENNFKEGKCYYIGTLLNRKGMVTFAEMLCEKAGVQYVANLPIGVEYTIRTKEEKEWHFIFNNTMEEKEVVLPWNNKKIVLKPFMMEIGRK